MDFRSGVDWFIRTLDGDEIPTTKVAIAPSNGLFPHQNGLPLLDCETLDAHNIGKMQLFYSKLIDKVGPARALTTYHNKLHKLISPQFHLQAINRSFSNALYETWEILHTPAEFIPALMRNEKVAYDTFRALQTTDKHRALEQVARCLWLVTNACSFERGSPWTVEVLGSPMLANLPSYQESSMILIRSNTDFRAFGVPIEIFCARFISDLEEMHQHAELGY